MIRKKLSKALAGILTVSAVGIGVHLGEPHGGRTDSQGGHYNRKTGAYHFHSGGGKRKRNITPIIPKQDSVLISDIVKSSNKSKYPIHDLYDFSQDTGYHVKQVVDGDTIKIEDKGQLVTIRLIGVDTPETKHPTKPVEKYGKEASEFTKNLLLGEKVYLRSSTRATATDKYGRRLCYVFRAPDGLFVNLEIIRQGYGYVYKQYPFEHLNLFTRYEDIADEIGKGLWRTIEGDLRCMCQ